METITDILKNLIQPWPILIGAVVFFFRKQIRGLLGNLSQINLSVAGVEIQLEADDMRTVTSSLFSTIEKLINDEQKKGFKEILARKKRGQSLKVKDIFPVKRIPGTNKPADEESEKNLTILRALRGFGLIEPPEDESKEGNPPGMTNQRSLSLTSAKWLRRRKV